MKNQLHDLEDELVGPSVEVSHVAAAAADANAGSDSGDGR